MTEKEVWETNKYDKDFTRVKIIDTNKSATVLTFLVTQMAVESDDGSFLYLFYRDRGITWEKIE